MIHHHVVRKIKHIRTKPDHVKQRILFVVMSFFVVVIVGTWVATFHPNFSGINKIGPYVKDMNAYFSNTSTAVIHMDSDPSALFGYTKPDATTTITAEHSDEGQ